jgi:hypothetical protein
MCNLHADDERCHRSWSNERLGRAWHLTQHSLPISTMPIDTSPVALSFFTRSQTTIAMSRYITICLANSIITLQVRFRAFGISLCLSGNVLLQFGIKFHSRATLFACMATRMKHQSPRFILRSGKLDSSAEGRRGYSIR